MLMCEGVLNIYNIMFYTYITYDIITQPKSLEWPVCFFFVVIQHLSCMELVSDPVLVMTSRCFLLLLMSVSSAKKSWLLRLVIHLAIFKELSQFFFFIE